MLTIFRDFFAPPRDLILVVLSLAAGVWLAEKRAHRYRIGSEDLNDLVLGGTLAFLIGGRLFFTVENLAAFIKSPVSLISLNLSLFDIWGGLGACLITGLVIGNRKRLSFWDAADALTPILAALAIGIGLSHLASGAAYGQPANLPWSIDLWGARRHPTQVYEILAAVLTMAWIWFIPAQTKPGHTFLTFLALAAFSRLVIEGFRGDSLVILGGLRAAQLAAWLILAAALTGLESLRPATSSSSAPGLKVQTNPDMHMTGSEPQRKGSGRQVKKSKPARKKAKPR